MLRPSRAFVAIATGCWIEIAVAMAWWVGWLFLKACTTVSPMERIASASVTALDLMTAVIESTAPSATCRASRAAAALPCSSSSSAIRM